MTSMESVEKWLQDYVAAWKTYDAEAIKALFSEDAEYRYDPFGEPVIGRDAIAEDWRSDQDEPGSFEAAYHPVAINGDTAVSNGRTQYFDTTTREMTAEFDNMFLLKFDSAGLCTSFTEWYMERREDE